MDSGSRGRKRPAAADVDEEIPEEEDKEKLLSQSTSDSAKPPPYEEPHSSDEEILFYDSSYEEEPPSDDEEILFYDSSYEEESSSDEEILFYDSSYEEEPPSDEEILFYDSSYEEEPPSDEEILFYDSSYEEEPPSDEEILFYDSSYEEPPSDDEEIPLLEPKDLCVDLEDNKNEKDVGATDAAPAPVESSRPPLSSEKRNSKRKAELKIPDLIENDGDSDDEDDQCISSLLKRKRCSKEIKKEGDSDYNDLDCKSTMKTKQVSVEIKDLNDDYVDNIQSYFNEVSESVLAKLMKESWQFEEDMLKDDDLCLNALCALRRQSAIIHAVDKERFTYLTQLLTDGDSQRKLTKTALDLNVHDLHNCRMLARMYSVQIFGIYQKKNDPFFPPRS